jgi:hypothetical protein
MAAHRGASELRIEAEKCLRIAATLSDAKASARLVLMAAHYLEKAYRLEGRAAAATGAALRSPPREGVSRSNRPSIIAPMRVLDPRSPIVIAWLKNLPIETSFCMRQAMLWAFPDLADDMAWRAELDELFAKIKPTKEKHEDLLARARMISRSFRRLAASKSMPAARGKALPRAYVSQHRSGTLLRIAVSI